MSFCALATERWSSGCRLNDFERVNDPDLELANEWFEEFDCTEFRRGLLLPFALDELESRRKVLLGSPVLEETILSAWSISRLSIMGEPSSSMCSMLRDDPCLQVAL